MEYLPIFLLLAAALIAGYFYLQRAKARDAAKTTAVESEPAHATEPEAAEADRSADRPDPA